MLFSLLASENATSSSAAGGGSTWMSWVLIFGLVAILVVFFIFSNRSNKKRQKETQDMLDAVKPGNKVKTIGGVCGIVVAVDPEDNTFILETGTEATGYSYLKFDKQAIYQTDATAKKTEKAHLSEDDSDKAEKADVVLADLPCSGLGVMGRKADIRYRVTPESLSEVAALQRRILSRVWEYVKPGGVLVYSTCTLNREENEDMAAWFARQFPFVPIEPAVSLPASCLEGEPEGCARFLPGENGTDGFFIACFRRKEEN